MSALNETENKITDLKTIQTMCYEMLCDIDEYCRKKNIKYYLSGGSCLGAIRHHDFIPWDDDIDIMLPRDDYDRLMTGFNRDESKKYSVGDLRINPKWARPHGRIWRNDTVLIHSGWNEMPIGIAIDVFPIDGLPNNAVKRWIHYKCTMVLHLCRNSAFHVKFGQHERAKVFKAILAPFCKIFGARRFAIAFDRIIRKYDYNTSNLVGAISAAHYWDKETMQKCDMDRAVYKMFGDRVFPVPVGYDIYLSHIYGNYMEMPSQDKINSSIHRQDWDIRLVELPTDINC